MAAVRLRRPGRLRRPAGPWPPAARRSGEAIDLVSVFEGVGAYRAGKIDAARLKELEDLACPSCGSCSGMFTANSMNCLMRGAGPGAALQRLGAGAAARSAKPWRAARPRAPDRAHPHGPHARGRSSRARRSTTPSRWTWPWAARRTRSCTRWPSPARRASTIRWRASTRSPTACRTCARSPLRGRGTWTTCTARAACPPSWPRWPPAATRCTWIAPRSAGRCARPSATRRWRTSG